jgi:6-phosphogluconolactonase
MSQILRRYDAKLIAEQIHGSLTAALGRHGSATLAIPGGRSPGDVIRELARRIEPELRDNLHLLFLDERAVPVGSPDRNDGVMLGIWLEGGKLPGHIHAMPAELPDLEIAAKGYAQTLEDATQGRPIDVCLIGIGEDGHMASLFPSHSGLLERRPVFAVYNSPKPPPKRLTLSLPVIKNAAMRVVLALGEAKWEVARQALAKPDELKIPCSLLAEVGTYWYADDPTVK